MAITAPKKNIKGISVIEILIVIGILGVTLTSLLGLASFSLGGVGLLRNVTQANAIAQETMEAARNFRDQTSWNSSGIGTFPLESPYHPEITIDSLWTLAAGEQVVEVYTRKVVFSRVYRDLNGNISSSGTEDTDTRKISVTVSWQERGGTRQIELITYFTNWKR